MELKTNMLNLKILFGFFIVLGVIGSVIFIILYERQQLREIESDTADNHYIRYDINTAHRLITELATLGESVISWEDADYQTYHKKRLCTDSLLQNLQPCCLEFIRPEQIDTLRGLLASKEKHLFYIMQIFHKQEIADSLLIHRLPLVTREVAQSREIIRKKKGIAGWFGKKDTIRIAAPARNLYALNEQLIEMQDKRKHDLESHTYTLGAQNRKLNDELLNLISQIDNLAQTAFQQKGQKIAEMRLRSFRLMSYVLASAILLLLT